MILHDERELIKAPPRKRYEIPESNGVTLIAWGCWSVLNISSLQALCDVILKVYLCVIKGEDTSYSLPP